MDQPLQPNPIDRLPTQTPKKSFGPVIGIVIIIVVLIIGALYFWGASLNRGGLQIENSQASSSDPVINDLSNTSASDDLDSISNDLSSTQTDNLDNYSDIQATVNGQ